MQKINATPANRKQLRSHAREAMAAYSRVMTWLVLDADGDLSPRVRATTLVAIR